MKKEKITIEPMFKLEEDNKLIETSWVSLNMDESNNVEVKFFNRELMREEFDSFSEFATSILENIGSPEHEYSKVENKNFVSVFAIKAYEDENYDERLNAVVPTVEYNANLVYIYNGGLELNEINKVVDIMRKDMDSLVLNQKSVVSDSASLGKDPHYYYGISKRDFS